MRILLDENLPRKLAGIWSAMSAELWLSVAGQEKRTAGC
jgi:hypothetical protein